jgi:hypothetical protein
LQHATRQIMKDIKAFPVGCFCGGNAVGAGEGFQEECVLPDVVGELRFRQGAVGDALDEGTLEGGDRQVLVGLPESVGDRHGNYHSQISQPVLMIYTDVIIIYLAVSTENTGFCFRIGAMPCQIKVVLELASHSIACLGY